MRMGGVGDLLDQGLHEFGVFDGLRAQAFLLTGFNLFEVIGVHAHFDFGPDADTDRQGSGLWVEPCASRQDKISGLGAYLATIEWSARSPQIAQINSAPVQSCGFGSSGARSGDQGPRVERTRERSHRALFGRSTTGQHPVRREHERETQTRWQNNPESSSSKTT